MDLKQFKLLNFELKQQSNLCTMKILYFEQKNVAELYSLHRCATQTTMV